MKPFFGLLFLAFAFAIASPIRAATNIPPATFPGVSLLDDTSTKPKTPNTDPAVIPLTATGVWILQPGASTSRQKISSPATTIQPIAIRQDPVCDFVANFTVTSAGQLGYSFPNMTVGPEISCMSRKERVEGRAFFGYSPTGKVGVGGSTINGGGEALLWLHDFGFGGGIEGSRFMSDAFKKHGWNPELLVGFRFPITGIASRLMVIYLFPTGSSHWGSPANTIQDPMLSGLQFRGFRPI